MESKYLYIWIALLSRGLRVPWSSASSYPHGVAWKTTWIKLERCIMSSDHQKEHGNQFDAAEAKWKGYARSLAICPERTCSPPAVMPGRERAASSTVMHHSFTPLHQPVWAALSLPPAICTEEDKEKPRWVQNREDIHKCRLLMNRSIDIDVSKALHWECNCRFATLLWQTNLSASIEMV